MELRSYPILFTLEPINMINRILILATIVAALMSCEKEAFEPVQESRAQLVATSGHAPQLAVATRSGPSDPEPEAIDPSAWPCTSSYEIPAIVCGLPVACEYFIEGIVDFSAGTVQVGCHVLPLENLYISWSIGPNPIFGEMVYISLANNYLCNVDASVTVETEEWGTQSIPLAWTSGFDSQNFGLGVTWLPTDDPKLMPLISFRLLLEEPMDINPKGKKERRVVAGM